MTSNRSPAHFVSTKIVGSKLEAWCKCGWKEVYDHAPIAELEEYAAEDWLNHVESTYRVVEAIQQLKREG